MHEHRVDVVARLPATKLLWIAHRRGDLQLIAFGDQPGQVVSQASVVYGEEYPDHWLDE